MKRICVIDSGVDYDNRNICAEQVDKELTIKKTNDSYEILAGAKDIIGHGTAILSILQKDHSSDVSYIIIKIFDDELICDEETLLFVLNYIYNYIECDFINLSLGITFCSYKSQLYDVCKKITEKGTVIISAFDNNGAVSYPAAFSCVIGVDSHNICQSSSEIAFVEDSIVNCFAFGKVQRISRSFSKYMYILGTSAASANVTRILASMNVKGIDNSLKALNTYAKYYFSKKVSLNIKEGFISKIKKAILFPYNKEMHSLVMFNNMLAFEIAGVYDTPKTGLVGRKLVSYYNNSVFYIGNWEDISWNDDFDTVIVGHIGEYNKITNENWFKKTAQLCLKYNKKIYCFDEKPSIDFLYNKIAIDWPHKDFIQDKFGKLYDIIVPVLGIFGTGTRQGKYTLQLILRNRFIKEGYRIGQIGSEPSSLLFGMDDVFHFGYNEKFSLSGESFIEALNDSLNTIQDKNVDIILAGCQSGTIPYDIVNTKYLTTKQIDFLIGISPDYSLLCINLYDDIEYIERTINVIEALGKSKVIATVVFPMTYAGDHAIVGTPSKRGGHEVIVLKKEEIAKELKVPCYELGKTEDMEELFDLIINNFSEQK